MYKLFWRLKKWFDKYFYDDRFAGTTRFFFFLSITGALILLGYNIFEDVDTSGVEEIWKARYPIFFIQWVSVAVIRFLSFVVNSFRHAIIPVAMFFGVLFASAYYVQDVYELPSFRLALQYIFASFLGFGYPNLTIEDGKKQIKKGETNLLDTIGGPGYVNIRPGNVVLFESLRSPSSVRSSAFHFISRFESIREIVSLDDQHGFIKKLKTNVRTKDGIQIIVRDVHYRYRLRTGRRFGDHEKRKAINPYPYSVQAVKDMAYNRSARATGLTDWHSTIQLAVDSAIKNYIKAHKFDQLTAPSYEDDDPRAEISKKMMSRSIRTRLRNWGAELLWFDIGHFDVVEKVEEVEMKRTVEEQRLDTWSARLDGDAMVVRSYGEARRLAYQDIGRAEGQGDMLMSIVRALKDAGFDADSDQDNESLQNLRTILWMRVAQVLDRVSEEEKKQQRREKLPPNSTTR